MIAPKRFVQRLKKDNELFRSYMHQVRNALSLLTPLGNMKRWETPLQVVRLPVYVLKRWSGLFSRPRVRAQDVPDNWCWRLGCAHITDHLSNTCYRPCGLGTCKQYDCSYYFVQMHGQMVRVLFHSKCAAGCARVP